MKVLKNELTLKNYKLLFESLYPQLCVFAYGYLDNLDRAKELVQEVFIKVWEDQIAFNHEAHAASFFYKSIKTKCLNTLKSRLHRVAERIDPSKLDEQDIDTYFMAEAVTIETTAIIEYIIGKLPNKATQVIRLSLKNLTNKEISEKLNISINTVKDYKKTAYQRLREYLSVLSVE